MSSVQICAMAAAFLTYDQTCCTVHGYDLFAYSHQVNILADPGIAVALVAVVASATDGATITTSPNRGHCASLPNLLKAPSGMYGQIGCCTDMVQLLLQHSVPCICYAIQLCEASRS